MIYSGSTALAHIPNTSTGGPKYFCSLASSFVRDIKNGFICKADGNGMKNAGIYSGDFLLFDKGRDPENGDIVYLEVYGEPLCRRVFFEPSPRMNVGRIRIRKEDGITPDLVADERDVEIGGIFEGLIRKNKRKKTKIYHYLTPDQAEEMAREDKEKEGTTTALPCTNRPEGPDPSMSIHQMGFPVRLENRLTEIGMRTAKDLLDIPDKESLLAVPGLGVKSYKKILETLESYGYNTGHLYW